MLEFDPTQAQQQARQAQQAQQQPEQPGLASQVLDSQQAQQAQPQQAQQVAPELAPSKESSSGFLSALVGASPTLFALMCLAFGLLAAQSRLHSVPLYHFLQTICLQPL